MKVYQTNEIKNISILGSSGSGKTTLAEAMLYEGGVIKRRGTVEAGNTVSDYFPVEKEYGWQGEIGLLKVYFYLDFGRLIAAAHVNDLRAGIDHTGFYHHR